MIKRLIFDVDGTLIAGSKFFSSIDGKIVTGNAIIIVIEEVLKKQEQYLDNADINESDITNI